MIRYDYIFHPEQNEELQSLLTNAGIILPANTDDNVGVYKDEKLVGCGFLKGNMLQGIALDENFRGKGLAVGIVSRLIRIASERGIDGLFLITKPSMAQHFECIGFRNVAEALPYSTMLEYGTQRIDNSIKKLTALAKNKPKCCAGIVMNANPFTNGHRYLIEKAARENPYVWVIIVEEDVSEFSTEDRMRIVKEGTKKLENVQVIGGDRYVISSVTFPSYFTKSEDLLPAQASLDACIFKKYIAPALHIRRRYVGTEPLDHITQVYNRTLAKILSGKVELVEVQRLEIRGKPISASQVREYIQKGEIEHVFELIPEVTKKYLLSSNKRRN